MDRRAMLIGLAGAAVAPGIMAMTSARPEVRVRGGRLAGVREEGVRIFRGIPYAAAPAGSLRFRPPQAASAWTGLRDAVAFGSAPIQPAAPGGMSDRVFLGADTSEDCLYLNVWAPDAPGPHPVLAWIHGGGNMAGAASQAIDGLAFARAGVVCVTIGYRVGAFGFLDLGQTLGSAYAESGTNGLRDLVAALRWLRANVSAFGGDPARVTIGGVSAGGKNVTALMAMPEARGLFASAIVESGGGETLHDKCSARAVARLFTDGLGARGLSPADLAAMPAAELNALQVQAMAAYARPFLFRAIAGSQLLPRAPLDAIAADPPSVRLLLGSNRDESIIGVDRSKPIAPLTQRDMSNVDLEVGQRVAARYDEAFRDLDPLHRRVRMLTAEEYGLPTHRLAETARARGTPVWRYRFDRPAASGPFAGWVPHGMEAMYVWQSFDQPLLAATFGSADAATRRLGAEMTARWAAFVHGRAPDAPGAAPWPRYDGRAIMSFAGDAGTPAATDSAEWSLWDGATLGPPACA